jgi:rhamnogalacturonan endolyase
MTDHCYWMGCLNENIGYNQPTNTGYYLGSDLKNDAEAWAEAEKVQNKGLTTGIVSTVFTEKTETTEYIYDLSGRKISVSSVLPKGIYIQNGKKIYIK